MATSGNFLTSDSGQGGGSYFSRLIFEWWRTGWGRSGSVGYHNISYTLKSYGGSSGYWMYTYNNSMNVDGSGYSRGQTQVYGAGATTILSGSKTLYTDSVGNRSFGASAQAGIYTNAVNSSGSGSWSMDNIPMGATFSSTPSNYSETTKLSIGISNPANGYIRAFIRKNTGADDADIWITRDLGRFNGTYQFVPTTAELNALYASNTSASSWGTRCVVRTYSDSGYSSQMGDAVGYNPTFSVVAGEPVFSTYTYKDANSSIVAITGNDQYIIQGYSTLEVDILATNKAVAQKYATMVKYNMAIGGVNVDQTYSTSDIAKNLGTIGLNASGTLAVKAIDSRNLYTTVNTTVNILPYQAPQVVATANRVNNFETTTDVHIEGVISRLTISGTDKNAVNTSNGVQYRYKKTTDASWSSWVNKTSATSSGNVSVTDFQVSLDRNYAWQLQVIITDKLASTTVELVVPVGIPIFRIGLDGKIYNNEVRMPTVAETRVKLATVVIGGTGTTPTASISGLAGKYKFIEFETVERMNGTASPSGSPQLVINGYTGSTDYEYTRVYAISSTLGYESGVPSSSGLPFLVVANAYDVRMTKARIARAVDVISVDGETTVRKRGWAKQQGLLLKNEDINSVSLVYPTSSYAVNGITVTFWGYN